MRKQSTIAVSDADRQALTVIVMDRNSPQKHVWRAQIVLLTVDGCGTMELTRRTGTSKTSVWRWQQRFVAEGVPGLLRDKTRPARIPPLGAEVEARVVAPRKPQHLARPRTGPRLRWPNTLASASVRCNAFGASMACNRIKYTSSSCPTIRGLLPNCSTSSGFMSLRRRTPLSCRSTKRAKFRRLTGPSRACR